MSEVFVASSQKSVKCLATINVFEISNWTDDKVLSEKFSRINA